MTASARRSKRPYVALVHDYLTQRGGAERVVLSMMKAFPDAALYTSLYFPDETFPQFRAKDIRTLPINRVGLLRRHHRLALPFLATSFSRLYIDADVVLCSSSGWAHGVRTNGAKIVYCYTPARWLYQTDLYAPRRFSARRLAINLLRKRLIEWDRRRASEASRFVTSSRAVQERIRSTYGIEADILPPPYSLDPTGPARNPEGIMPGFYLCVARLLPYKNIDAIARAVRLNNQRRLVVVGKGPDLARLKMLVGDRVTFLASVPDDVLRWLYQNCRALVAAGYEDYGLTPLDAAAFGKPSVVLRFGGYLDTMIEGITAILFDEPHSEAIASALDRLESTAFDPMVLRAHAARFSEGTFIERLRALVDEVVHVGEAAG